MSTDDLDRLLAELGAERAALDAGRPATVATLDAICRALIIGAELQAHALGLGGLMGARRRASRTRVTHRREERPR